MFVPYCLRLCCLGVLPLILWVSRLQSAEWTLEVELPTGRATGMPIAWSDSEVSILGRDGRLIQFAMHDAQQYRKVADVFSTYTSAEMKAMLLTEFGPSFQVSSTAHYLVVHGAGQRDPWAQRFESFYRAFVQYFAVRGWRIPDSRFPLVAVVFPTQDQYLAHARATRSSISRDVVGYYSPVSNRIVMYDLAQVDPSAGSATFATIAHEAAHQAAFNMGVHDRLRPPPLWLIEGLGTLFEARAVWDPRGHPRRLDRVNPYRLACLREYLPRRQRGSLADLLANDRLFESDAEAAYAEVWAFSFFLSETRPRQYIDYLQRTARPTHPPPDRLQEFTAVFGTNLPLLEMHYLRFLREWTAEK